MCSVKNHWYFCCCILYGHLLITVASLNLGIYKTEAFESIRGSLPHSLSVSSDRSEGLYPFILQEQRFTVLKNGLVSCKDLDGVGSFDTTCVLNSELLLNSDVYAIGKGNLEILPHVSIVCPIEGCTLSFNLSGNIKIGRNAAIVAGSIKLYADSLALGPEASINATALAGPPPSQTSGTPVGYDGAGGGHGGRGASCVKSNDTNYWGGDVYCWTNLPNPWCYGSKGGGTSDRHKFGGNGGGRILLNITDVLSINGSVTAEGGEGGLEGGGGSGGSIVVYAKKLKGFGIISAAGGRGWGGGGGGRISLSCYSKQEDVKVTARGGFSTGCQMNSGAAGTYFDASLLSLRVGNDNITTETETPLLDFSTSPLWTNVYVENNAKVLVPLLWSRVQVRGQISLLYGSSISFGLSDYPVSEFELVAEELLMSYSVIKVYGALRVAVKMLLMLNSKIEVDGGGNTVVTTSILEVRNLAVLKGNSIISSNANLALYGQGLLTLTGHGDAIKGQRVSLSLFYNITVGPGSLIQAPLGDDSSINMVTKSLCESPNCPMDLITPPDDCHVNYTLTFSLQICRVEDIYVSGVLQGSIIHIHRSRTVIVDSVGAITASALGCSNGVGQGNYSNGAGGGAGHGGRGGSGIYNGILSRGGQKYGSADLPCELGSGSGFPNSSCGRISGGGMIVMGSTQWPLIKLDVHGSVRSDGESCGKAAKNSNGSLTGGLGGGSGGTILLFLQSLSLSENSSLSVAGGYGGPLGGGGGGGGRVHFHWSNIYVGNEYVPLATVNGTITNSGGAGNGDGIRGEEGTVTGRKCPEGLYGTFCTECPVGTFKNVVGSDANLCTPCSFEQLPSRAFYVYVRGGVTKAPCPYKCISQKYRMPNCYTPFEELIYAFGGPWPFSLLLACLVLLLALALSTLRIKLIGSGFSYVHANSIEHQNHHFPYLLSLSEVRGTRAEETQSHVHRMYFMGPNTFREPWHLPYSPPNAITEIVYEDAFNRFIDEVNSVAAYEWWEGSVHSILSVLAYPCAWSWKQWRRRNKVHRLQEYVKSEYDHSCLRSCRSRALYKGMKVGATPDLMIAYIDFFLGGDEKRMDMVKSMQKRFPMSIFFGGDGSYMSPYNLHSDTLLTNLLAQHVPASVWNRLVSGLNAQLRTVRHGSIRSTLLPVINWIRSHANPQLEFHGVKIELGWFQATASGYYQLGIWVIVGDYCLPDLHDSDVPESADECSRKFATTSEKGHRKTKHGPPYTKRITGGMNGGLINDVTLKSLDFRRDFLFPLSLLLHNTRPVGREDTVQLLISIMLLADLFVTLLILLLFYWMSIGAFLAVLLILPLSLLSPFPAGLNALFSKGARRASLARVYALWSASSLSNIGVAFICTTIHYGVAYLKPHHEAWSSKGDDNEWWLLPTILLIFKVIEARLVDWHIANLEIRDFSLFSPDPDTFWAYESIS
ncbi:OLC1v1031512C1 [Oldenlandia corymbosa var. corymbosa]|uniref:OLC1v1031512C1 n=1 Tax=Oldenlandia corymbosa var. corymbosa TaxID=529605 RepID=A0AAV1CIQ3_OLDCO|nr:OLC1v1031512C1 [Oldenlandia corymbosa var. corymbosa]